jgi:hypothetical protein
MGFSLEEAARAAPCRSIENLRERPARVVVARALRDFLRMGKLTPLELLHSSQQMKRLTDAGTALMAAVQKIAIAQVQGKQQPVNARVKELYDLGDAQFKAIKEAEAKWPATIGPDGLAAFLDARTGSPAERDTQAYMGLARYLDDKKEWSTKAEALLALDSPKLGLDEGVYLDEAMAELLRSVALIEPLVADLPLLGQQLVRLFDIIDGKPVNLAEPPLGKALTKFFASRPLPACRAALRNYAMLQATSATPLTKGPPRTELAAVLDLRARLERGGALGEAAEASFDRRASRLISDETLEAFCVGLAGQIERAKTLVPLYGAPIGARPKEVIRRYIDHLVENVRTPDKLFRGDVPAEQRLKPLAELHQTTTASSLPGGAKAKLQRYVEEFHAAALKEADPLARIEKNSGAAVDKAVAALNLCRSGALLPGDYLKRARQTAERLVKSPEFLPGYLSGLDEANKKQKLEKLMSQLIEAGLGRP